MPAPESDADAPLAGLRIIEISSFVAAPLGGMTLAQLGADVIRVDPLGGAADTIRWPLAPNGDGRSAGAGWPGRPSLYWAGLNKGKRSVTVDFRSEAGRSTLTRLVRNSGQDGGIVLTNAAFPWLSYDALKAARPDLIHLLITGILAAERHRRRTGQGRAITLPLADVALAVTGHLGFLAEAQLTGAGRPRIGNHLYGGFARDFRTGSGDRVMICLLTARHFRDLAAATGLTATFGELAKALDADFSADSDRYAHREVIAALLTPWFADRTTQEVADALAGTSVLWERYHTFADLAADPDLTANPVVRLVDQPGIGRVFATGSPLAQPGLGEITPAPSFGADTAAVLSEFNLS